MVTKFAEGAAEAGGSRSGGGGGDSQEGVGFWRTAKASCECDRKNWQVASEERRRRNGRRRRRGGGPWTTAHCGWQSQSYWQSVPSAPSPVLAVGDFYIVCTIILSIQLEFDRRRRPQDTFVPGRNYIHLNAITVIRPGSEWAWLCSEHVH